jgi:hypothetical protein
VRPPRQARYHHVSVLGQAAWPPVYSIM